MTDTARCVCGGLFYLVPDQCSTLELLDYLVDERAAVEAGDLTPPDVRHLEVRVEQQVEAERQVFARVVHSNVEVQLLFPQDQSVGQPEPVNICI